MCAAAWDRRLVSCSPFLRLLLIADVQALIDGGVLPERPAGKGLIGKLEEAIKNLEKGQRHTSNQ